MLWFSSGKPPAPPAEASSRSYFAVIPVLGRRKEGKAEKIVINFIHRSDFLKSNPILRAIVVENIRVCCIVVETSGKQSAKVLCASAPYILSLISRAYPGVKDIVESEQVSSCLRLLQESDLESWLHNVQQITVTFQRGVSQYYPAIRDALVDNSLFFTKKTFSHLFEWLMKLVSSVFKFVCDQAIPFLRSLYRQNFRLVRLVCDNFPQYAAAALKAVSELTCHVQNAIRPVFEFVKVAILWLKALQVRKHASVVISFAKKMRSLMKTLKMNLKSNAFYQCFEDQIASLFQCVGHHVKRSVSSILDVIKQNFEHFLPSLNFCVSYISDSIVPCLISSTKMYREKFFDLASAAMGYFSENYDDIKRMCVRVYHLLRDFLIDAFRAAQTVLPCILQYSSSVVICSVSCFTYMLDSIIYLSQCLRSIAGSKYSERLFSRLFKRFVELFESLCRASITARPYLVSIFRDVCCGLLKVIHKLSPTFRAMILEVVSSTVHASSEVATKSILAARCVAPSVWSTTKAVVPPTVFAANEVFNASTRSLIIVSPVVLKSLLSIRPELMDCVIVLVADGNRACVELATASYCASREIGSAARAVSSNLPVLCKAVSTVLVSTSHAAVEVSTTSLTARSRVSDDVSRIGRVVRSSVVLAGEELIAAVDSFNAEILGNESKKPRSFVYLAVVDKWWTRFLKVVDELLVFFSELNEQSVLRSKKVFTRAIAAFALVVCTILSLVLPDVSAIDLKNPSSLKVRQLLQFLLQNLSTTASKLSHELEVTVARFWKLCKACVRGAWHGLCTQAPQSWETFELTCRQLWSLVIGHVPGAWSSWKDSCHKYWLLLCDLMPYVWSFLSSSLPVLWKSGRQCTASSWRLFVSLTRRTWRHATLLTSEYWLLSVAYLPQVWAVSCTTSERTWNLGCSLAESGWTSTIESCLSSWNLLHKSVAKTWKSSLAFTKAAYYLCSTAGSVLKKSVYVCYRTKDLVYMYIVCDLSPHASGSSVCVVVVPTNAHNTADPSSELDENMNVSPSNDDEINSQTDTSYTPNIGISSFKYEAMLSYFSFITKLSVFNRTTDSQYHCKES